MNALQELINILDATDSKAFEKYLTQKNKRLEKQDMQLFKLLKTNDIISINNLYAGKNLPAYHALRKRLYDSLVDFMANRAFENDTSQEHEVLRLIVISRKFLELKLIHAAFKCLAKAEAKAQQLEHYSLLNEIYGIHLQYAHLQDRLLLTDIIKKFQDNSKKHHAEQQLNLAYALLRKELQEIYHKAKVINLQEIITTTIASHGISFKEILSYKSLYQILFIANEFASINNDFSTIEAFAQKSYDSIYNNQEQDNRQLYYQVYIMYFMANLALRNRKYEVSGKYLEKMDTLLKLENNRYYSRFILRYYLLTALNYHFSGNIGMAVHILEKCLKEHIKADTADIADVRLALIMCLTQGEDYRSAHKELYLLSNTDSWYEKNMGMDWAIKKALLEIVVNVAMEYTEPALSRITAFKRRYKKYLMQVKEERVIEYLKLLETCNNNPEKITGDAFKTSIGNLLKVDTTQQADVFILSFLGWLWAKANKKPVYEVMLGLINA